MTRAYGSTLVALVSISMIQEENPSETVLEVSCMKHETQLISNQHSQITQNEIINPHLNWGYNISVNKLCHILYGNRRNVGYKYFSWNCDRGLLSKNKIEDIKQLAARHKPHFMGISEVDLRRNEANPDDSTSNNEFSTEQVHDKLKIEGYRIFLPSSWVENDRARIIVYANEEVGAKILHNAQDDSHLQNILLEVGYGRSKKHFVNFYYREWKSCVTGRNSKDAQYDYFSSLLNVWRNCTSEDKDFISCGDTNICSTKMDDPGYAHQELSDLYRDFLIEEGCHQIVDGVTRVRSVGGELQRSCLDC